MGSHPINLAVRFLLELAALGAMGAWGWRQGEGWLRYPLAIGIPLVAAIAWGTFAVPGDPSRSGNAPVETPGWIRLALELVIFASATWALHDLKATGLCWAMGIAVVFHYGVSYDRIMWLLAQ